MSDRLAFEGEERRTFVWPRPRVSKATRKVEDAITQRGVLHPQFMGLGLTVLIGFGCAQMNPQDPVTDFESEDVERAYYDRSRELANGVWLEFDPESLPRGHQRKLIRRLAREFDLEKGTIDEMPWGVVQWSFTWPYWRFDEEGVAFCEELDDRTDGGWGGECRTMTRLYVWVEPMRSVAEVNCMHAEYVYRTALEERDEKSWERALSYMDSCSEIDGSWLFEAARHGDLRAFMTLLEKGVAVDSRDTAGWTALHYALVGIPREDAGDEDEGRAALVSALFDAGAEVNAATDIVGWTPLHLAAGLGNHAIVQKLLEWGALVNARTRVGGWTPLYIASRRGAGPEVTTTLETAGGMAEHRENDQPLVYLDGYGSRRTPPFATPEFAWSYSWRGTFVKPQVRERLVHEYGELKRPEARERLIMEILGTTPQGQHLMAIGIVDGGGVAHVLWVSDSSSDFMGICRDYAAGLDHVEVIRRRSDSWRGNQAEFWHYDESEGSFVLDYSFEILYREYDPGDAETELIYAYQDSSASAELDYCRWKTRKVASEAFAEALQILQVGELPAYGLHGSVVFSTRAIDSMSAERHLAAIRAMPADIVETKNGLEMSESQVGSQGREDDPSRVIESDRWEIFKISGAGRGADGHLRSDEIMLVHDKALGEWHSIYDCTDLEIHELRGSVLFAGIPNNSDGCGSNASGPLLPVQLDLDTLDAR